MGFVQKCFEEYLEVRRWCVLGFAVSWLDLLTRDGRDHWGTQLLWGKGSNFSPEFLRKSDRLEVQARSSCRWWDCIEGKCSQRVFVLHNWLFSVLFYQRKCLGSENSCGSPVFWLYCLTLRVSWEIKAPDTSGSSYLSNWWCRAEGLFPGCKEMGSRAPYCLNKIIWLMSSGGPSNELMATREGDRTTVGRFNHL